LDLSEPLWSILGDMQSAHLGMIRAGLGPDTAAPAGANDADADLFHRFRPLSLFLPNLRNCHCKCGPISLELRE
jgi:hypothetical protein